MSVELPRMIKSHLEMSGVFIMTANLERLSKELGPAINCMALQQSQTKMELPKSNSGWKVSSKETFRMEIQMQSLCAIGNSVKTMMQNTLIQKILLNPSLPLVQMMMKIIFSSRVAIIMIQKRSFNNYVKHFKLIQMQSETI